MFALMQDWTEIEGVGDIEVLQSGSGWLHLEGFQDVTFYLDVKLKENAELQLHYDTAPSLDPTLFASMGGVTMSAGTPLTVTRFLLSRNPTLPLAGLVRWRIKSLTALNSWRVLFRIACFARRPRGWT